jgi:hypothetical protein
MGGEINLSRVTAKQRRSNEQQTIIMQSTDLTVTLSGSWALFRQMSPLLLQDEAERSEAGKKKKVLAMHNLLSTMYVS